MAQKALDRIFTASTKGCAITTYSSKPCHYMKQINKDAINPVLPASGDDWSDELHITIYSFHEPKQVNV